ncbi:NHLP bacteriocin export ABC transporter permease/ATPase subunit [Aristaeella lactis]|uniref:NHLM bacteriocin system ABC transporter, ATP-binding protein n=1 Tax=Aristaeella lactis TaxID=3046383 RepID=A0AC61PJ63_9FIRM|nr:NHLP bacteriocin export ABC transporter permease/ATPase subunit [Aristaeella lactis]QUA54068.1 NHLP bacteriocin export ABC transporter permease/ATPase subunit [Aristaeella lactis]SMC42989.1 NHLM bacteriocin system ABC transporter, ATP-binding protein [Aristaeella lactis]
MGWFDDQIEFRKKHERELLSDSFENIARSVTGRKVRKSLLNDQEDVSDAVSALLRHMGVKEKEVPPTVRGLRDRLDYLLSSTGILYREIILTKGWQNDAMGPMIASLKDSGAVIAVLPSEMGGYEYMDPATGKKVGVNVHTAANISEEALCFYRPLPMRALKLRDLLKYMMSCLTGRDLVSFGVAALAITLVGLLIPKLNQILTGTVIATGSTRLLLAVVSFLLFATITGILLTIIRNMLLSRIRYKLNINVSAATMMRILSLPASFFKSYSVGELNQYISYMDSLCTTLVDSLFSTAVTGLFSLIYLGQIMTFAPSLVWPSLIVTLLTLAVSLISARVQMRIDQETMVQVARERGLVYSLINGIQKIRLSGAENRAFAKWSELYVQSASTTFNPPAIIRLSSVLTTAISLIGTAVMYFIAVKSRVSIADYFAFNASYANISTAFSALATMALSAASIKPVIQLIKPLLEATPEASGNRETVTRLSGNIEISHVTFSYDPDSKPIFEDFCLTIPARQYVAIVGKSGCGKSTLVRLLLGFEKPTRGVINYDRKDLQQLDMRSVRRQIGTVMQDGRLFSGSIFDNIVISAPTLKLEEAWEAAEIAGIADDIRDMPMGMHTVLQDGGGTISGGQRQRLMIARAIAPKPRILIFDEATSALDNITQRKVSEALDKMKCTRIVIAHRLSTIKHCDRILVIDGGKIAEDGTYEELIAKNGIFAELVERQKLSNES